MRKRRRPLWPLQDNPFPYAGRDDHPRRVRMDPMPAALHLTGDPSADKLLTEDPFALLTGMLLDQQIATL